MDWIGSGLDWIGSGLDLDWIGLDLDQALAQAQVLAQALTLAQAPGGGGGEKVCSKGEGEYKGDPHLYGHDGLFL